MIKVELAQRKFCHILNDSWTDLNFLYFTRGRELKVSLISTNSARWLGAGGRGKEGMELFRPFLEEIPLWNKHFSHPNECTVWCPHEIGRRRCPTSWLYCETMVAGEKMAKKEQNNPNKSIAALCSEKYS